MRFGRGLMIFLSRWPRAWRCRSRFRWMLYKSEMASPFTYSSLVQFSETDLAGIAHFANFFRWMEEAEHAYFRSVGLSVRTEYQDQHLGWPRLNTSCEFFAPARFEDQLQLKITNIKMTDKSITWEIEFLRGATRL